MINTRSKFAGIACAFVVASALFHASVAAASSFLVANFNTTNQTSQILRYDYATGAFLGNFTTGGPATGMLGMTFGPDGNLYICEFNNPDILKFNGSTGAYIGIFANTTIFPYGVAFGPDDNLYVGGNSGSTRRFNGVTGAFIDTFITPPVGVDFGGMTFHDGYLFISYLGGKLYQYNAASGLLISNLYSGFISNGPRAPRVGPDGNLYVPEWQTTHVAKFNGNTYAFMGNIVNEGGLTPIALEFGPDGKMLVLSDSSFSNVRQYNPTNGAYLKTLVDFGTTLDRTTDIKMVPEPPRLTISRLGAAQVQISWQSIPTNFIPEFSTNLPATTWSPVTNAVTRDDDQHSVAVDRRFRNQFFRLRMTR